MLYLDFLGNNFKKLLSCLKSAPSNLSTCKILLKKKKKCLKLGPKCLIQVFLGQNFKKAFVIFEVNTLKFVQNQNFGKKIKQKWLNLRPKMSYLDFLGQNFKEVWQYFKSAPSNLSYCKISRKTNAYIFGPKMPCWIFLTENALFGYFWGRISKQYCHISNQHSRICVIAKIQRRKSS